MTRQLPRIALSVRQPWAWGIVYGGKDCENRIRPGISFGGMQLSPICIHASAGMTRHEYEFGRDFMERLGVDCPRPEKLVRGAIIGRVTVVKIVTSSASPWFVGPSALLLTGPLPVKPIPVKGALGYFKWERFEGEVTPPLQWMMNWGAGQLL